MEFVLKFFFGGQPIALNRDALKNPPQVVIGTPGRILQLVNEGTLDLKNVKHFILDECDKMLHLEMRDDVQKIFKKTPHDKQVMMFTATLSEEMRPICKKFMKKVTAKKQNLFPIDAFFYQILNHIPALRNYCY